MPTAYTTRLRLAKPATGELSNTWGDVVNQNITDMVDQAIAGVGAIALSDANYTLTTNNGTSDNARNAVLSFTGALTADRTITAPAVSKMYVVRNATTGGFSLVMSAGGTTVTVPSGQISLCYTDGTDFFEVAKTNYTVLSSTALTATLATNLNANSYKVTNLGTPTVSTDAVTKAYADGLAFSAALPAQSTITTGFSVTSNGTTASWSLSTADNLALYAVGVY